MLWLGISLLEEDAAVDRLTERDFRQQASVLPDIGCRTRYTALGSLCK
jgi:hypothetical protein